MFGSAIVEVVIGLAFVYFILSVIASHINELIAGVVGWRAADLERGIRNLLADAPGLADSVWQHGLVSGLGGKPGRAPSYVPASNFASALIAALAADNPAPRDAKGIRTLVDALPPSNVHQVLLAIVNDAGEDVTKIRAGIEAWYNSAMDRVSGVYKRRIQWVTLGVAAVLTIFLGADSIAIETTLWQDQALRSALTGAAQSAASSGGLPGGLEDTVNTLTQFDLPLGWVVLPQTVFGWFLKVLGLLLTILAVSLGAPFWFDFLKQILKFNPRASGPAPASGASNGQ
jgi:hypothetical protein